MSHVYLRVGEAKGRTVDEVAAVDGAALGFERQLQLGREANYNLEDYYSQGEGVDCGARLHEFNVHFVVDTSTLTVTLVQVFYEFFEYRGLGWVGVLLWDVFRGDICW